MVFQNDIMCEKITVIDHQHREMVFRGHFGPQVVMKTRLINPKLFRNTVVFFFNKDSQYIYIFHAEVFSAEFDVRKCWFAFDNKKILQKLYSIFRYNTRYNKAYARASTKINILAKRQEDFYGNEIPFFKKMKFMIEFQLKKLLRIFFGLK